MQLQALWKNDSETARLYLRTGANDADEQVRSASSKAPSHPKLRVTTDVKHLEFGLTDKANSVDFILDVIAAKRQIANEDILFLGDEFGPIGSFEGSDFKMFSERAKGAAYISVGKEPNGVPEGVFYYGKGTEGFKEIIDAQLSL